jgi:hypothetical protein
MRLTATRDLGQMPRFGYSASSRMRKPAVDSDTESEDGYGTANMASANHQIQAELMMVASSSRTHSAVLLTCTRMIWDPLPVTTLPLLRPVERPSTSPL